MEGVYRGIGASSGHWDRPGADLPGAGAGGMERDHRGHRAGAGAVPGRCPGVLRPGGGAGRGLRAGGGRPAGGDSPQPGGHVPGPGAGRAHREKDHPGQACRGRPGRRVPAVYRVLRRLLRGGAAAAGRRRPGPAGRAAPHPAGPAGDGPLPPAPPARCSSPTTCPWRRCPA